MPATLIGRMVNYGFVRTEIRDGERRHIAYDLTMSEVQPRLSLTDQRRIRYERE